MLQFRHKFQVGAGQVLFNPLVDSAVQFRTEVIFPVSRFTLNLVFKLKVDERIVVQSFHFADKLAVIRIHPALCLAELVTGLLGCIRKSFSA